METVISTVAEFIPEWNKNKEDPTPIVVEHKVPTMKLKEILFPKSRFKALISATGEFSGGETETVVDNRKLNEEMITGIRNFKIVFNDKRIEVKTAKDLYGDVPPEVSELAEECGRYFQKILNKRVETKN